MCVLVKMCFYNTIDRIAYSFMLSEQLQCTMLYLLQDIGFAIRMMQIGIACLLVHKCLITHRTKGFPYLYKVHHCTIDRLCTQVKVTCIKPAAYIQFRNMLTRFE